jgi:hypothetical protein
LPFAFVSLEAVVFSGKEIPVLDSCTQYFYSIIHVLLCLLSFPVSMKLMGLCVKV